MAPNGPSAAGRLIVALDTTELARAEALASAVAPFCGMLKLGLEFFLANGASGVRAIRDRPVFLDLKLHDIPNTVAGGVRAVLPLRAEDADRARGGRRRDDRGGAARVRGGGGRATAAAGRHRADQPGRGEPERGRRGGRADAASAPARPARDGLGRGRPRVQPARGRCAAQRRSGPRPRWLSPAFVPPGSSPDDQARTMTPAEAVAAGADWIVVGRPVTAQPDPGRRRRRSPERSGEYRRKDLRHYRSGRA